ncbi:hypothetical protein D9758_013960 [Tetrapyrgos nigripes]|uniref:Ribonuclease H1 N-terminal domain-containing protein n=1 Tax=Tetrapyrgos nigripes TaxID=182062 RepID=A0A8H5G7N5_9AGAR|nr:hypothetical protein D9758_013960 [Tetrapyrgos nigripes]
MPRPKLYHTKLEQQQANRNKSLKHYHKNRDTINTSRCKAYEAEQTAAQLQREEARQDRRAKIELRQRQQAQKHNEAMSPNRTQLLSQLEEYYTCRLQQMRKPPSMWFDTIYHKYVSETTATGVPSGKLDRVILRLGVTVARIDRLEGKIYQEGGISPEFKKAEVMARTMRSYLQWAEEMQFALHNCVVFMPTHHRLTLYPGDIEAEARPSQPETSRVSSQAGQGTQSHPVHGFASSLLAAIPRPSSVPPQSSLPSSMPDPPPYTSTSVSSTRGEVTVFYGFNRCPSPQELLEKWPLGQRDAGYVVSRGTRLGFFAHWSIVVALTNGVSGHYQKKFEHFDEALQEYSQVHAGTSLAYPSPEILSRPSALTRPNRLFSYADPQLQNRDLEFEIDTHQNIRVYAGPRDAPSTVNRVAVQATQEDGHSRDHLGTGALRRQEPIDISDVESEDED